MLIGDLDLERAQRDPLYRRRVTAFLRALSDGEDTPADAGPDDGAPHAVVPARTVAGRETGSRDGRGRDGKAAPTPAAADGDREPIDRRRR